MLVPTAQTVLTVYDLVADTVVELRPHNGYTRRAVFSPDGAQIASVGGEESASSSRTLTTSTSAASRAPRR